jgi:exopolysaccharide production negative regulator
MRISSLAATGVGLLAASLMASEISYANESAGHSGSQEFPTASFAPANVQLPQETLMPAIETSPDLAAVETLDPLLSLELIPKEKRVKAAYRYARKAIKQGDFKRSIVFFTYAAEKGHLLAQWRLAKAFRDGRGVEKNDVKALELFRIVADSHDPSARRNWKKLRATVSALVALADYSRTGVTGTSFTKNLQRSQSLYRYAATRYGHPGAQYQLGVMYLNGEGIDKSQIVGMKWLMLASRKGFAKAQAMLGDIYLSFKDNPKSRLRGLMWHRMAEKNAAEDNEEELLARSGQIFAEASDSERELAVGMIVKMRENGAMSRPR